MAVICLLGPQTPSVTFTLATVKDSPAGLESLEISSDRSLKDTLYFSNIGLKNTSQTAISKYQIGWEMTSQPGGTSATFGLGPNTALKSTLQPGDRVTVTQYPFVNTARVQNNTSVFFFIAAVEFNDGTSWTANTSQLSFKPCVVSVKTATEYPVWVFETPCRQGKLEFLQSDR